MPKMKSKGAVKKRFRVSKNGKVKCSKSGRGHMHASKSAQQRRNKATPIILTGTWARSMMSMMGKRK